MRVSRCLALVPCLALAPALIAQKVVEPRLGLQFTAPKGWTELPGDHDRHATLRLFAAPRAVASRTEAKHTPVLRVMFFANGGDDSKDVVDGLPRTTPFRSLEDFVRRGHGAKDVVKEARKVGGVEGQSIVARDITGDFVLVGQTWPLDDGEAAICIHVLANQADKLKKEIDGALGSLEGVARAATARIEAPSVVDADWKSKDAAARKAARRKWAEDVVAATVKAAEAGYKVSKAKHWTVLSNADAAFTKKVVAAAEAARDLLAKKVPELATEPPLPAVLRVFDSVDHAGALAIVRNDIREFDGDRRELYVVNDRDNGGPTSYGPVLRAVWWQMVDDVDPAVLPALPRWLDYGCWEVLRSSTFDGRKYEFAAGDVERGRIDYYRQKKEEIPALWGLIQEKSQVSPTDGSTEPSWGYTPECSRLMRWLWFFDGLKAFGKPTLVGDYVKAIGVAHEKVGPNPVADVSLVGLTDAQLKDRNARFYKWRDAVLVAANDIAVPLTIRDWQQLNEKWVAFNKSFK